MDGQVLKERLSKLTPLTQMELAEKLNVSQQSFSQYFLAKDVKSGLLERLADIIGVDIPTMYGIEPTQAISHNAGDVITGDNIANRVNDMGAQMITILDEQLKVKDEQIRVRDEQIDKLLIFLINKVYEKAILFYSDSVSPVSSANGRADGEASRGEAENDRPRQSAAIL